LTITVAQYMRGDYPKGATILLHTWQGPQEVTGYYTSCGCPWLICGKANAGLGMSCAVHAGLKLLVR